MCNGSFAPRVNENFRTSGSRRRPCRRREVDSPLVIPLLVLLAAAETRVTRVVHRECVRLRATRRSSRPPAERTTYGACAGSRRRARRARIRRVAHSRPRDRLPYRLPNVRPIWPHRGWSLMVASFAAGAGVYLIVRLRGLTIDRALAIGAFAALPLLSPIVFIGITEVLHLCADAVGLNVSDPGSTSSAFLWRVNTVRTRIFRTSGRLEAGSPLAVWLRLRRGPPEGCPEGSAYWRWPYRSSQPVMGSKARTTRGSADSYWFLWRLRLRSWRTSGGGVLSPRLRARSQL